MFDYHKEDGHYAVTRYKKLVKCTPVNMGDVLISEYEENKKCKSKGLQESVIQNGWETESQKKAYLLKISRLIEEFQFSEFWLADFGLQARKDEILTEQFHLLEGQRDTEHGLFCLFFRTL